MSAPVVLCDANVLYSILMTDLILSLGEAGLFRPRWTIEIHNGSGMSWKISRNERAKTWKEDAPLWIRQLTTTWSKATSATSRT
ncbi:MAG: hypothetical protein ABI977_34270 [Acidobacteriota bacterium]